METTALLCPVPRLGPLLAPWRDRHDASAAAGMPPHVTVLAPFLAPEQIRPADLEDLQAMMAMRAPVETELTTVGMFDSELLHLRPDPDAAFRELTQAVADRFGTPPYEGRHDEVIPHVTVGKAIPRPRAHHAARALMLALPIRIRVDVAQLWVRGPDGWVVGASFPLGTAVHRVA